MAIIKRDAIVPYTPQQMFDLVNTIEDYPQFVPACKSTQIISRTEDEVHATLEFAHGSFHKAFSTCNRLQTHKMIEIRLINGPFRHLEGFWRFEAIPEGCRISLDLEFEFSNKLLAMMFSPVFHPVADKLVDVFCERARVLHGG